MTAPRLDDGAVNGIDALATPATAVPIVGANGGLVYPKKLDEPKVAVILKLLPERSVIVVPVPSLKS